ncbi:MAG: hypothetical protein OXG88_07590 [Gammaproteobacteria bacterium]|nr:hypothetical protein [Gammaproteobacteria bacterium]
MATPTLTHRHSLKKLFKWTQTKERNYPWVLALIAGSSTTLLVYVFEVDISETLPSVLNALVVFGAITSGFVGTSLSVLVSIGPNFKKKLIRSHYIHVFQNYLRSGLLAGFLLAFFSILGMILTEFSGVRLVTIVCTVALVYCFATLFRVFRIMLELFAIPDTHERS